MKFIIMIIGVLLLGRVAFLKFAKRTKTSSMDESQDRENLIPVNFRGAEIEIDYVYIYAQPEGFQVWKVEPEPRPGQPAYHAGKHHPAIEDAIKFILDSTEMDEMEPIVLRNMSEAATFEVGKMKVALEKFEEFKFSASVENDGELDIVCL